MSDFRPYFLYLLRGIASGVVPVRCVRPAPVDPHFQAADVLFCVFDDAGELDYIAWAACGQDVKTMGELTDVENQLTAAESDALEAALWSARDEHDAREAEGMGDTPSYIGWLCDKLSTAKPVTPGPSLPPIARGIRQDFIDAYKARSDEARARFKGIADIGNEEFR